MAAGATDVVIRFLSDVSDLKDSVGKIEGTTNKLKSWAKGAAAAVGTAFAVDKIKDFVDAGAELQDQLGASKVIFGGAAGAVDKFAQKAADSFGISRTGALDAANQFAAFGKSAGLTGDQLGGFATGLTGLAGDLASFRGTSTEDAITAVGAALRGETEPIRKYGVLLDDATLRARAMSMGLISTTKDALTPQQKVLAAQAEILAQTTDAQGDFARTSDSAANQQKILKAEMENVSASIGTALLPVVTALAPILQAIAGFIAENAGWLVPLTAAILAVTAAIWLWNIALAANPIVLVTIAVAALVAGIILLWKNWDTIWNAVLGLLQTVWGWIASNWPLLLAILTGPFGLAVKFIVDNWSSIIGFFSRIPGWIAGFFSTLGAILVAPFQWAWGVIVGVKDQILGAFGAIPGWITEAFRFLGTVITSPFKTAFNLIADFWNRTIGSLSFSIPDWVPGIGGKGFDVPDIPKLAAGGIVRSPTLALLGEAGPEAVIPLSRARGGGDVIINVTTTGLGADAPAIQSAVVAALRQYTVRNGPLPAQIVG